MIFKLIAFSAALLTATGFIPQIIRGFKTRHLNDVSTITLGVTALGTFLWAIYGFYLNDPIIITANIITCSSVILLLVMKRIYKTK